MTFLLNPYVYESLTVDEILALFPSPYISLALGEIDSFNGNNHLRVRRDSDNAEQDFVVTDGGLDTAGIAAFCTTANGFVRTAYGIGTANNLIQATTSRQPKVYDGATQSIVTENGKPALFFDGGDWLTLTNASAVAIGVPFSFFFEYSIGAVQNTREFVVSVGSGGLDHIGTEHRVILSSTGTEMYTFYQGSYPPLSTLVKRAFSFDGQNPATVKTFNYGAKFQEANTGAHDGFNAKTVQVGARVGNFAPLTNGYIRSVIVWDSLIPEYALSALTLN
jgi:hypothetical protein